MTPSFNFKTTEEEGFGLCEFKVRLSALQHEFQDSQNYRETLPSLHPSPQKNKDVLFSETCSTVIKLSSERTFKYCSNLISTV